jgi:DNA repair protein RadC
LVYETLIIREDVANYFSPLTRYTSPEQVFLAFRFLQHETKEYFFSLHMDGKNRTICIDPVSVGTLNQSLVHPREVFSPALKSKAAGIILVHNHPTGSTDPSREDMEITKRLKEAGELLGIKVIDHIIIGETYLSFVSQGLI